MTKSSKDFQILKFVLINFFTWKVIVLFLAFFGLSILPINLDGDKIGWASYGIDFWSRFANWDGGHFRGIAERGYFPFQAVFFPLYPILIKTLIFLGIPSLWGGLIISNTSLIGALFFLYKLVSLDFDESISKKAVFLTLAFPTSFYFGAVYSESLFLFLVVASFYFARKKNWLYAYLLAGLCAVTRLTGIVVILAISLEYFLKRPELYFFKSISLKKSSLIDFKKIFTLPSLFSLASFLPLISYSIFLGFSQNDPLAFINQQINWQRQLNYPWISPIQYFQNLWQLNFFRIGKTSAIQLLELSFFIFYLILLILCRLKLRVSYTLFFVLSLVIPLTTGTLQAIPRYGMVIFPIYILLALVRNETFYQLWLFISLTLLGVLAVIFINGFWVS